MPDSVSSDLDHTVNPHARRSPYDGHMAHISREEVAHVARLARIELSGEELDTFTGQLGDVLDHARDIEALDVADVPPTAHPYPLVNVLRPDQEQPCLSRDDVLAAAPAAEDGQFRVPPVLGEAP
jgi:aspartyl-tRNA(Asn)/glutamyl-tRNA(Gln) amidotransferase subunit C